MKYGHSPLLFFFFLLYLSYPSWHSSMLNHFSHVQLYATLMSVTRQAPLSIRFSRQGYWSGLPFPSPEDLSDPGIEPRSPALEADALTSEPPGKILIIIVIIYMCMVLYSLQYLSHPLNPLIGTSLRRQMEPRRSSHGC